VTILARGWFVGLRCSRARGIVASGATRRAAIIAESYSGAENVVAVARRHALAPSQRFTWRSEYHRAAEAGGAGTVAAAPEPLFVPAVIDVQSAPAANERTPIVHERCARQVREATAVDLEIDGVSVKIARGADASVIGAVIDALKTTRDRPRRRCPWHGGEEADDFRKPVLSACPGRESKRPRTHSRRW
jgi:transposase